MPATIVSVSKAKAQLSALLERALSGEEIILAKRGQLLATLTPLRLTAQKRKMGFAKFNVEVDFDERITARMEFEWRE